MRRRREFFGQDVLLDARLASKHRFRRGAISVGAHVAVVLVLLLLPKSSPVRQVVDDAVRVVFVPPAGRVPEPAALPPPPPAPRPKPKAVPKPEPAPRPAVPPPPRTPEPAPAPRPVEVAKQDPPPPPPPPARKPLVGAFADAPASPAPVLAKRSAVASAGFEVAASNGAPVRASRAVTPAAFETESAPRPNVASTRTVHASSFDETAPQPTAKAAPKRPGRLDAPVEILSKPRPAYTEQARRLRIEGEVVLEVMFFADGKIAVVRVLEGLGHGLDEAAVEAAKKIEFSPARREGRAVDHEATLRIVFRLA